MNTHLRSNGGKHRCVFEDGGYRNNWWINSAQSLRFFELYAFIILTSTLVLGINYFVIITRPLHPTQVRKRSSSSGYMIET